MSRNLPTSCRPFTSLLVLLALLLIVALAAYLRLYRLHTSPIWGDQSILMSIALDWVNWGKIPLAANKSSAGAMNPPLVVYLLALPLFVRQTVMSPLWFQALLGLTAVPLLYFLTARFFGRAAGLVAAFLFALNPWLVYYSRLIWNPSLTPLFATLLLTAVLLFLATRRWPYLLLVFAALALLTQLHLSSLVLLPVVAFILLLFGRRLWLGSWRRTVAVLAAGMGLFVLLYTPYLLFERAMGFADVKALGGVLTGAQLSSQAFLTETAVNAASFFILKDLALGEGFRESQVAAWQTAVTPLPMLFWLLRLLALAAWAYAFIAPLHWRWRHRAQPRPALPDREMALLVSAIWVTLPVLLYVRHSQYLQNYFFLYLTPAACLLLAGFWERLWQLAWGFFAQRHEGSQRREGAEEVAPQVVGGTAVLLLTLPLLLWGGWQFWFFQTGLALADRVDIWQQRAAGDVQQAVDILRDLHATHPDCTITLLAEGYQHDSSPVGLMEPLLYPLDVAIASAGRGFVLPGGCTLYL
ncbi:MAG TPA: glycosyltransferase family 39 protein, partial [Chloroflexota bacterium]|nr:glycosyltransferase family 39 protein [Chloroflexota bacterium]